MTSNPLGPVGTYVPTGFAKLPPADVQRAAVRRLEAAGYPALWVNETGGGKDALVQTAILLAATERVVFGTGVVPVWSRAPMIAHAAATQLAEAYPGRFVLGIGVGHPPQAEAVGREYGRPVPTLRDYLRDMRGPAFPPALEVPYPLVVAAMGPKMLALGAEAADGVFPAMQPPEFTARARQVLGPDKLVLAGIRVVAGDAGDAGDKVAAEVRAHQEAGADHVTLLPEGGRDFLAGVDYLVELAPAVLA